ncbi:RING finger protein 215 isoform X4 [Alligator mississippiensis]|uniref:RING finger protein 215 isoform X4 n=1 Tax=Alligator mississippiensis TaxID=8496 RepID=UPI0028781558|nr:RING finger protein 215 isoform X4 [Alligator mississippiensis]
MAAVLLPLLLAPLVPPGRALPGRAAARVEVLLPPGPGGGAPRPHYTLQGAVLGPGFGLGQPPRREVVRGRLRLVGAAEAEPEKQEEEAEEASWIGVVPLGEEQAEAPRSSSEESFTAAVVSKMKRALVLGASALLILALNQNAIRELDVSLVLAKPVIVIQSSDNVTKLLGALLRRGLRATAKITYQTALLENLKYLQQLWNTILLIALILCTGVIVQAQRQSRQDQSDQDTELDLKQLILQRLSALKTRRYHPGKHLRSRGCEIDSCAVCLDQFHKNQVELGRDKEFLTCLRVLPCSHEFHRDCVDPWLLLQQTCPLCKHNILGSCCGES